ncbi:conserved hypothetical protein [Leptospira interrogans serovar Manilae]|uniref:Uncharacterized protein n=1 Tax=Leptospira interrogans serovar Manilae TaxID=214675 RepID=A0AAQ1NZ54_LEPIR|nr:conserved hypothetical protein [Leptospira interrogans serovar Manilae]
MLFYVGTVTNQSFTVLFRECRNYYILFLKGLLKNMNST